MRWKSLAYLVLFTSLGTAGAGADAWEPLDPELLALKAPKLDPEADAEYLLRRVRIEDKVLSAGEQLVLMRSNYVRLKIYTERGKERHSVVDLRAVDDGRISGLRARTILPDGKIIEVEKADIFERDVKRANGVETRQRSFALPGVEVGAVVEYQWTIAEDDTWSNNLALLLQADEPTWKVEFELKPIDFAKTRFSRSLTMRSRCFQCNHDGWKRTNVGWFGTSFENVPAFREEPFMPPEERLRSWILVYYTELVEDDVERHWKSYGKDLFASYEREAKADAAITKAANEIVAGATTPAEKVLRLVNFCRTKIKNVHHPTSGISTADLGKRKPSEKASETLARGMGTGREIQRLLIALATAAGFEARLTRVGSRDDYPFEKEFRHDAFLSRDSVAIKVDHEWRFFDGADPFVEPGMLTWQEEGTTALIADRHGPEFVTTPRSPPERTQRLRLAYFTLAEDGSLSGDVEVTETGFFAFGRKWDLARKTAAERAEALERELIEWFPTASVEGLEVDGVDDVDAPFSYRYRISIPAYSQRTGTRLFVVPSVFGQAKAALFTADTRTFPIAFDYPWTETDEIEITLPSGFELEGAESPGTLTFDPAGSFGLSLQAVKSNDRRVLRASRQLVMGKDGYLGFPVEAYPAIKGIFDAIYRSDQHVITLKAGGGDG